MLGFIRRIYRDQNEFKIVLKLSSFFLTTFLLYLFINYVIIYSLSINDIKVYLQSASANLVSDFDYKSGQWNTDKYLSDINTPTEVPLYIFSIDGFLMDRLNLIHGFLDTSNFDYASSFTDPKTITSPVGESWRLYSYFIKRDSKEKGVVLVAYFDPRGISEKEIDATLRQSAVNIDSAIQMNGQTLDISRVRLKDIDPNVSVEVVDTFNRSLVSYGGSPAYIDKSYIQDALSQKGYRTVQDKKTNVSYLVYTNPMVSNNQTLGVVIVGKGLDQLEKTLGYQLWFSLIAGVFAILLFIIIVVYLYRHDISDIVQERLINLANPAPPDIQSIIFNKEKGFIIVNKDIQISIPTNSHQYDICLKLFQSPNKKFDTLDLGEATGDQKTGKSDARMVYDAILSINEKVRKILRKQLIRRKDHLYCINPELAAKIRK